MDAKFGGDVKSRTCLIFNGIADYVCLSWGVHTLRLTFISIIVCYLYDAGQFSFIFQAKTHAKKKI